MTEFKSAVFDRAVNSIRIPLNHFLETGFWNPYVLDGYNFEADLGEASVRRVCRNISKELRRPFIQAIKLFETHGTFPTGEVHPQHGYALHKSVKLDVPKFRHGYVEMPKVKFLMPMVSPLLLAADSEAVHDVSIQTIWQFRIMSEEFWDSYYDFILNDPVCRKARRLTS